MSKLHVPYEIKEILGLLDPYVSACYYELLSGIQLSSMTQRKSRAVESQLWDKYNNIGLAVELYKQTKLMNTKEAY